MSRRAVMRSVRDSLGSVVVPRSEESEISESVGVLGWWCCVVLDVGVDELDWVGRGKGTGIG